MAYRTIPFRNSSRMSREDIADFYEERDKLKESEFNAMYQNHWESDILSNDELEKSDPDENFFTE